MGQRLRKGDLVEVTSGKFRGKRGAVVELLNDRGRVRVEGIATVKRHLKAQQDPRHPSGGIVEKLGSVHISNVMPVCPKTDKPTRVSFGVGDDGKKIRLARRSGAPLAGAGRA